MICLNCKKEFTSKVKKKFCSVECRTIQAYKRKQIRRTKPNSLDVDKIILSHDPSLVVEDNDWVFSESLSDWCRSRKSITRIKDRDRYRNRKK